MVNASDLIHCPEPPRLVCGRRRLSVTGSASLASSEALPVHPNCSTLNRPPAPTSTEPQTGSVRPTGHRFTVSYTVPRSRSTSEITMTREIENMPKEPSVDEELRASVRLLVDELKAARVDAYRHRRWMRNMSLALAGLLAAGGWSLLPSLSAAQAPSVQGQQTFPMSSQQRAERRKELLALLPEDKRRELETFEREVDWLNAYMHTWDEGKAGAVVAMMLFHMGKSMDTMPSMEQQMRAMSGQMGALPAIVAELGQINAKMHVITTTMDSTMGRAGRMMPWMPFSP